MAHAELVARMRDCLERQAAVYEEMLADAATLEPAIDGDDLDALLARQEAHQVRLDTIEREFGPLDRAWHEATGLREADRAGVRVLAHRAADLAARIAARYSSAQARADAQRAGLQQDIGTVRRGRGVLDKYGSGTEAGASFIDRKA